MYGDIKILFLFLYTIYFLNVHTPVIWRLREILMLDAWSSESKSKIFTVVVKRLFCVPYSSGVGKK